MEQRRQGLRQQQRRNGAAMAQERGVHVNVPVQSDAAEPLSKHSGLCSARCGHPAHLCKGRQGETRTCQLSFRCFCRAGTAADTAETAETAETLHSSPATHYTQPRSLIPQPPILLLYPPEDTAEVHSSTFHPHSPPNTAQHRPTPR